MPHFLAVKSIARSMQQALLTFLMMEVKPTCVHVNNFDLLSPFHSPVSHFNFMPVQISGDPLSESVSETGYSMQGYVLLLCLGVKLMHVVVPHMHSISGGINLN